MRQAEVAVKRGNFFLKLGEAVRIRAYLVTCVQGQRTGDEFGHLFHVFFLHAASGHGWRADSDAGGFHGRTRVKRDGVLVYGDAYAVQGFLRVCSVNALVAEVYHEYVVVRTVGDDAEAEFRHFGRHGLGVFDNLGRIVLEFGFQGFSETGRLGGNDVHEGAALHSGETAASSFWRIPPCR